MKKIVTIGEVLVEIIAKYVGEGFLTSQELVGPFPSGAPAIFIDQVAKLDQPCGIISCVGDDDFGRLNIDRLRSDGVDVSAIRVDPGAATGSAFVRYRPDGERDFVFNIKHSAAGGIKNSPEATVLIESADHLHVVGSALYSPRLIALVYEAIAHIKAKGGTISFDPNIRKEMLGLPGMRAALMHALENADVFLPSGPELLLLSKEDSEHAAVEELLGRGPRVVVLKDGAAGARYYDRASEISCTGLAVNEVDPTGAGDIFGATFVTLWLRGAEPREALTLANVSGALAVGRLGPMEGTSTLAEIRSFMRHSETERTT